MLFSETRWTYQEFFSRYRVLMKQKDVLSDWKQTCKNVLEKLILVVEFKPVKTDQCCNTIFLTFWTHSVMRRVSCCGRLARGTKNSPNVAFFNLFDQFAGVLTLNDFEKCQSFLLVASGRVNSTVFNLFILK